MDATGISNRGIDRLMRVKASEVLNHGESSSKLTNPAQDLSILARDIRSEVIDESGMLVDYDRLAHSAHYQQFVQFTHALPNFDISILGNDDEKMSFWINLYNALILDAVIQYKIRDSMMKMPSFFRRAAYNVGGHRFSADDIEHGVLRRNQPHPYLQIRPFGISDPRKLAVVSEFDPRIHFALVCGATSCPPIAYYEPTRLDDQLRMATSSFINGGAVSLDAERGILWMSRIFKWYQADFGGKEGISHLIRDVSIEPDMINALDDRSIKVRYQRYDWSINNMI